MCKPKREDITEGWIKFHNEEHHVNVSKNNSVNKTIFNVCHPEVFNTYINIQ